MLSGGTVAIKHGRRGRYGGPLLLMGQLPMWLVFVSPLQIPISFWFSQLQETGGEGGNRWSVMLRPRWRKAGVEPQAFVPCSNSPASRGPSFVPKRSLSAGSSVGAGHWED